MTERVRTTCPFDPTHGQVIAMAQNWYCPHAAHDGLPGREGVRIRAFFTTDEVQRGSLKPAQALSTPLNTAQVR